MSFSAEVLPNASHKCQTTSKKQTIANNPDWVTAKTHYFFTQLVTLMLTTNTHFTLHWI